jgi:ABC-type transporter Mla subunit MlaD
MKKNLSDYIVALVVVACSLVLLGALTIALTGFTLHKSTRTLEINFPNVAGIRAHSELRYAGAPAGRVVGIRTLTQEEREKLPADHRQDAVRVKVSVEKDVPIITEGTIATVGSDTLLSEKYIALNPGKPDAKPLANDATLEGTPGLNIDNLAQSIGPLLDNANKTMVELRDQVATIMPKLGTVLDSTNATAKSAEGLVKDADKLIADNSKDVHQRLEDLGKVMDSLKTVLATTNTTVNNGNKLVGNSNDLVKNLDRQLAARMEELSVVLQNLKVVSTYAKSLTETLAKRPQAIIWGKHEKTDLTPESKILRSNKPLPATQ